MPAFRKFLFFVAVTAALTPNAYAEPGGGTQDKPRFASCAWWQSLKDEELYRLGFAHGMVVGALADPFPYAPAELANPIFSVFQAGHEEFLVRPTLMDEYFTAKCADPQNGNVQLDGLTLIALLEKGGLSADRLEAALQIFRKEFAPKRDAILAVLAPQ